MHLLQTPEEVAAQASLELLARSLYDDEHRQSQLQTVDSHPTWVQLTISDRNVYRELAASILKGEYRQ